MSIKQRRISGLIVAEILVLLGSAISFPVQNTTRFALNTKTIAYVAIALVIFNLLSYFSKDVKLSNFDKVINSIVSLIYAGIVVIGRSYNARQNLSLIWGSKTDFLSSVLFYIAVTILLYAFFKSVYKLADRLEFSAKTVDRSKIIKLYFEVFMVLMVLALPYFILSFPGLADYDGMYQINELFRQKRAVPAVGQFSLTNHHPIFSTLLEGSFIKIGLTLFHSINVGILLNSIFLNLLTIASFSLLVVVVAMCFNKKASFWLTAFMGIFPVFFLWANALDKTGYFVAIFAVFLSALILLDKGYYGWKTWCLLGVSGVLLGLIRNDGFVYLFAAGVGSLTLKSRKKIISMLLLSLILTFGISKSLVNVTKALPSEPMESLAVPMQQIARVVTYNPDSLSQQDKKELNKFFIYKRMARAYNPEFADSTKINSRWPYGQIYGPYKSRLKKYESQPFVRDKAELMALWKRQGLKNKRLYFEALVGLNIFYLYPQPHPSHFPWSIGPLYEGDVLNSLFQSYHLTFAKQFSTIIGRMTNVTAKPIIRLPFISFTWFFLWLTISVLILDQRKFKYLNLIFTGGAIVLVSLLSPVNGFLRYTFPLIVLVPVMLIIGLTESRHTLLVKTNRSK